MTTPLKPPRPRTAVRDPERTRRRILAAALREFAARGFAGARVDRIALRARVNKRMLYHYFGNKEDLFRAILRLKVSEKGWLNGAPDDPGELLKFWFHLASQDLDWVRLVEWEALRVGTGGPIIGEAERRAAFERGIAHLRDRQARGLLARDINPREMLLAMIAVTIYPLAFPQITRLVTGHGPGDPGFRTSHERFLARIADAFRTRGKPASNGHRAPAATETADR